MKHERTLVKFECDCCNKISNESEQPCKFPYEEGWNFIYHLELKLTSKDTIKIKDKQFCSKECLIKFIEGKINK